MSGGERHSPPSTLGTSFPQEMKGNDGDYTGISLVMSLIKYKGALKGFKGRPGRYQCLLWKS